VRIADRALQLAPTFGKAAHSEQVTLNDLATIESLELRPRAALPYLERAQALSQQEIKLNPGNSTAINNWSVSYYSLADTYWSLGEIKKAIDTQQQGLKVVAQSYDAGQWFVWNALLANGVQILRQSDAGMAAEAKATLQSLDALVSRLRKSESAERLQDAACFRDLAAALVSDAANDPSSARELGQRSLDEAREGVSGFPSFYLSVCLSAGRYQLARSEFLLGEYPAAEKAARGALAYHNRIANDESRDRADYSTWLALALVKEGNLPEAARAIAPAIKTQRDLAAKNHGDETQTIQLASALYAQALTEPAQRAALLHEAAWLIDRTSPGIRALVSTRRWRTWITEASSQR
jgi:tetratricopeptide (TPR) repeat protein